MASHQNSDVEQDLKQTEQDSRSDYPVHVYFIDLSKIYMQQIRWHWHPEMEIIIVNHGEANFAANGQVIRLSAGQGVLINRNVMHSLVSADESANCSVYSTVFHPSFLFGENNELSDKFLPPVLESPMLKTMFLDENDSFSEKLLDLVNSVIAANLMKKYGYELSTKATLCQFWMRLLEYTVSHQEKPKRRNTFAIDEDRVKTVIGYMNEHYADQVTLEELADHVHISKSECCRCFKRTLHLSPIEYLMQLRICMAANRIQNSTAERLAMSELARDTGFHNASYFNKVFRQFMHCTPSEYKRAVAADPAVSPFYLTPL